ISFVLKINRQQIAAYVSVRISGGSSVWPEFLKLHNFEDDRGHGLRLSQTSLAVDAALFGQGAALVSRFLVATDIAAKRLIQITPETLSGKQDFYLLAMRKSKQNAAIDTVVTWFLAQAGTPH
uniref:LysR substrate-binding domain-containing protein n=1 Tax=Tateyamaria pelophila TaxID=328415 RepID=UPI0037D9E389